MHTHKQIDNLEQALHAAELRADNAEKRARRKRAKPAGSEKVNAICPKSVKYVVLCQIWPNCVKYVESVKHVVSVKHVESFKYVEKVIYVESVIYVVQINETRQTLRFE